MDILNKMLRKKKACLTMVLILLTACAYTSDKKNLDKDQAWEIIKKKILNENLQHKIVYIYIDLLKAGQAIKSWEHVYTVPKNFQNAWLFFVDDKPGANWEHACRYIFINTGSGKHKIIKSSTPPDSMDRMKKIFPPPDPSGKDS